MGGEGIEAVGEAVTGAAAARAAEPAAGEAAHPRSEECLNCGTPLIGPHCHFCGQSGHVHRNLGGWWHDLAHGVLHLDGKIWRTLPLLVVWPGDLTRRYIEGERARFVSPLALFLFSVFLMFAVFSAMGATVIGLDGEATREMAADVAEVDQAIAKLEAERRDLLERRQPTAKVEGELRNARAARAGLNVLSGATSGGRAMDVGLRTGWKRLDKGIEKANSNPSLLFYKVQTNAYKFSWALIPISLPFLWMLFLHRRRYRERYGAYDHIVFVTYSISFMSLALIGFVLLQRMGLTAGLLGVLLLLVPPAHIYRQLRGAYQLSRPSALWRTAALLFSSGMALTLFMILLLALGVLG